MVARDRCCVNRAGLCVITSIFASAALSLSSAKAQSVRAQTRPSGDEVALRQLEQSWSNAFVKRDKAALERILAADWRGQYPWGEENREQALNALDSGEAKVESIRLGAMTVRVFGDIAFIQGSDDEKSSFGGADTSGHFTWTDVFQRRGGRWQAIASQLTQVKR